MDRTNMKIDVNVNLISDLEEKLTSLKKEKEEQRKKFEDNDKIDKSANVEKFSSIPNMMKCYICEGKIIEKIIFLIYA